MGYMNGADMSIFLFQQLAALLITRQIVGNLKEVLLSVRVQVAQEMLIKTDFSVKRIAHRLGYQNSDSFTRAFKCQMGSSPAKWKEEQLKLEVS